MTYETLESSVQDGRPVYKFKFVRGSDEFLYTSAPYVIGDSEGTFQPAAISASNITQTGELAKNGIKIKLPRDNALAQIFLGFTPELPTTVTIFRAHNDPTLEVSDDAVYWKGRVAAAEAERDSVTLECEDIFTSMRRPGLRAKYQKGCRYALFSSGCGVDIDSYADAATVDSQNGFVLTLSGDSNSNLSEVNYYLGGIIKLSDGSMRYIVGHDGNNITLISTFPSSVVGQSVTIYPGCAHTTTDCKTKFNNLENYGGFPYIPAKNPFRNSVEGSIV